MADKSDITTEPMEVDNSDVGAGASVGVWVTGVIVAVLILLAIFGLG